MKLTAHLLTNFKYVQNTLDLLVSFFNFIIHMYYLYIIYLSFTIIYYIFIIYILYIYIFLLYSMVSQSHIHVYILFPHIIKFHLKWLDRDPSATQQDPIANPFWRQHSASIYPKLPIPPSPSPPHLATTKLFSKSMIFFQWKGSFGPYIIFQL